MIRRWVAAVARRARRESDPAYMVLQARFDELQEDRDHLAVQFDQLRKRCTCQEGEGRFDELLAELAQARLDIAKLRSGYDGYGEVLRERATNRALHERLHTLTMANIAADPGWK